MAKAAKHVTNCWFYEVKYMVLKNADDEVRNNDDEEKCLVRRIIIISCFESNHYESRVVVTRL